MGKKRIFLKEFFKEKKTVGSVAPSSRHLGKKMLKDIDFSRVNAVVELGPGTGVFTDMLLNSLSENSKLLIFELHEAFYKKLKEELKDDHRAIVINDSAEKIGEYLHQQGLEEVDVVISSLPLANFKKKLTLTILKESHRFLKEGGLYVQFQYSLTSQKLIKRVFEDTKVNFTPRNIPPAFIYTCTKK
ncbi:MAG: methyltransferase domain-containing protein [Brumimicrobium sp.]|nr:methyltransferase domain-containing protein [Brumimicrobium sp.]